MPGTPGRRARVRPSLRGMLLAAIMGASCLQPAPRAPTGVASPPAQEIHVGHEIDSPARAVFPQRYSFALEAGSAAVVEAQQAGLDVELCLFDPAGRRRVCVDRRGENGTESLAFIADESGAHELHVAYHGRRSQGHYRLVLRSLGRPSAADAARASAQALEFQALTETRDPRNGALRRAGETCDKAVAAWGALGASSERAMALRRCAEWRAQAGETAAARARLEEAERIFARLGEADARSQVWGELAALAALDWRRQDEAREWATRALRARDPTARALGLHALGERAINAAENGTAARHLLEAAELWSEMGDVRGEAATRVMLGEAYTRLGRDPDAWGQFTQARRLRHKVEDVGGAAEALAQLGWLQFLQGHMDAALRSYEQALGVLERLGRWPDVVGVLDRRASCLARVPRFDEALRDYERALGLARARGDEVDAERVLANIVDLRARQAVHARTQASAADEASHERAHARARALGDVETGAGVLLGQARYLRAQGRLPEAAESVERALRLFEAIGARIDAPLSRMSFHAQWHKSWEFLVETLLELHAREPDRGHDARAFEAAERARARTLLDSLAAAPAPVSSASAGTTPFGSDALDREEFRRARPLARVSPASLAEIQRELLDDDTLLLAYALGPERGHLWIVGRRSFETHELGSRADIEALATRVAAMLRRSAATAFRGRALQAATGLSDVVLGPAIGRLHAARRLLIVSDGALSHVPFAALPVPPRSRATRVPMGRAWPEGRVPLVADYEVINAPSASVLRQLRRQGHGPRPAQVLAVLADPVLDGDARPSARLAIEPLPEKLRTARADLRQGARSAGRALGRLPYSEVEADLITAGVPRERLLLLKGHAATREAVLGSRLADYKIVHFSTHGFVADRDPRLSGLALSERDKVGRPLDGFLRVRDLTQARFNADLVVLSACQTGLGADLPGEGLVGLTQAFLVAGARRVLVSLWAVDDRATAVLMQAFYRALLAQGLPPARALREAQLELLAQPEFAAPQHWAAFVLLGDWLGWPTPETPPNKTGEAGF